MGHRRFTPAFALAIALVVALALSLPACVTGDPGPADDELAELDQWAATADGKADLPTSWSELVEWLRDVYKNRMSAIWNNQEHPATPAAALDRIRQRLRAAGIADPTRLRFPVTVQRHVAEVDHSEINIGLPNAGVVRLVGDPKGAGAFFDRALFKTSVGPRLCLTWAELETAVTAAYVSGAYGVHFVCHSVTERVLRALDVGTHRYSTLFRTYQSARWIWGPVPPSFNSHDPADWAVSRACN
jgi:hypothetical protein